MSLYYYSDWRSNPIEEGTSHVFFTTFPGTGEANLETLMLDMKRVKDKMLEWKRSKQKREKIGCQSYLHLDSKIRKFDTMVINAELLMVER